MRLLARFVFALATATAVFTGAACGDDTPPAPTPTAAAVVTPDTRPAPDACALATAAEVAQAAGRAVSVTETGTKPRSSLAEDSVSFCNYVSGDKAEVVAQITWGRRPDAGATFQTEKPTTARELPGIGSSAYQNGFGVAVILAGDSLISVSVPGSDQAASLSATLDLARKAAARAK